MAQKCYAQAKYHEPEPMLQITWTLEPLQAALHLKLMAHSDASVRNAVVCNTMAITAPKYP